MGAAISQPRQNVAIVPTRFSLSGARTVLARRWAPIVALALVVLLSALLRTVELGNPCAHPCRGGASHVLIFDEAYYVNAARVIDHIHPPTGAPYHSAPLGKDPNAEHPQLAKLVIAAGITLLGDNPWGWRIGSILFGLAAIIALFALVRAAGGGPWMATGAAAVMATDNLALVHGRIATLDIYAVCLMIAAAALYLRALPVPAGVVLGVGGAMKLVALYLVVAIVLFEALRFASSWRRRDSIPSLGFRGAAAVSLFAAATIVTLLALVWLLDLLVPAHDVGTGITYAGNPLTHLKHMTDYALSLKSVTGDVGASSSPWHWLLDQKTFDYARVAVQTEAHGSIVASRELVRFQAQINPFIIFLAVPALFAAAAAAWRAEDDLAGLAVCWTLGTFAVFVFQADVLHRVSYLYYMLVVLPGIYVLLARMFAIARMPSAATVGWALMLCFGLAQLYPIRTL